MRVAIFFLCVGIVVIALGSVYDGIRTLNGLERVEHERDQWQRPGDVIKELNLKEGSVVVDLGSGVGYFALKLSSAVGRSGKVLAVDIRRSPLYVLRVRALLNGERNVDAIVGEADNPYLLDGSVDAVLVANTYHELTGPVPILAHLFRSLKPGGRLVIVDRGPSARRQESAHVEIDQHVIAVEVVETAIRKQEFEVVRRDDHFTQQADGDHIWWLIVARKPS